MEEIFHPPEDHLELYTLGRLQEPEVAQIEEHLLVCEACRYRTEEAADFALAMKKQLRWPAPAKRGLREWFTMPRLAMAGVFAAALLTVGVYSFESKGSLPAMASLQLTAMRGEMPEVHAAREVDLTLTDTPATGTFKVEVVDARGGKVWTGVPERAAHGLEAKVPGISSAGDYFVRLYDAGGGLLHEYGFHVVK